MIGNKCHKTKGGGKKKTQRSVQKNTLKELSWWDRCGTKTRTWLLHLLYKESMSLSKQVSILNCTKCTFFNWRKNIYIYKYTDMYIVVTFTIKKKPTPTKTKTTSACQCVWRSRLPFDVDCLQSFLCSLCKFGYYNWHLNIISCIMNTVQEHSSVKFCSPPLLSSGS